MTDSLRARLETIAANPMNRFLPLFFVYMALIVTFSFRVAGVEEISEVLGQWTASLCSFLLSGLGGEASVLGKTVTFKGFNVIVVGECAGLMEFMMFAAAVIAYPAGWFSRLLGLAIAIPILFGVNVFRIAGLLVVGIYEPTLFEFAHIYLWQGTMILLIGGLWMAWIRFVVPENARAPFRA